MASTSGQSTSFSGEILKLSLKAEVLDSKEKKDKEQRQKDWREFQARFLQRVCGARNTPNPAHLGRWNLPQLPRKSWWQLEITLENKKDHFDYIDELSGKVDEYLHCLLSPRSNYPDVFLVIPGESTITFNVASSDKEFATLDYKTKQSANKGLMSVNAYGLDSICYNLYQKRVPEIRPIKERSEELKNLQARTKLQVSEDARLQFKRLQKGQTVNNKIETGGKKEKESFDPEKPADHYVEWIWTKYPRGLGEYVSAFSKIEEGGGAIYYGINERKDHTGYEPAGNAIDAVKMEAIKGGIRHKIRHEMLWIQRDQEAEDGYKELKSEEIRCQGETASDQEHCHFAVDFIEVKEPSSPQSKCIIPTQQPSSLPAKYVIEVRVAPFNGVVFYDPQGPEAYRMEKKGGKFKPVRVSKKEWLEKMRDYGWCSKHRKPKKNDCALCISEQNPGGGN